MTPGAGLIGSLTNLGILGGSDAGSEFPGEFRGHRGLASDQLAKDLLKLNTDLRTLASRSNVTLADLSRLVSDGRAITATAFRPDTIKLDSAVLKLAKAVASGSDTTRAKADFAAVFSGSSVPPEVIDRTIADIVRTITDSKVTTADLQTIAADRAAIRTDLATRTTTTTGAGGQPAGRRQGRAGGRRDRR